MYIKCIGINNKTEILSTVCSLPCWLIFFDSITVFELNE